MAIYKVFTVSSGTVTEGAEVGKLHLQGAGVDIPAVFVGEEGRGSERGVLPVQLPPDLYRVWQEKGTVRISAAEVGTTKAGKPKLFAKYAADSVEKVIVAFPTMIGYRGSNSHTGDRSATKYELAWSGREKLQSKSAADQVEIADAAAAKALGKFDEGLLHGKFDEEQKKALQEAYGLEDGDFESELSFAPFPGQILIKGVISQGAAGRMGSGEQLVAVMPKGVVFRTQYGGRLYGAPSAHYYVLDGERILAATWDERAAADLF